MKFKGDLIVTTENQENFKELVQVSGFIKVEPNATFTAQKLIEVSGSIHMNKNSTFTAQKLKKSGCIYVSKNSTFTAPKVGKKYIQV